MNPTKWDTTCTSRARRSGAIHGGMISEDEWKHLIQSDSELKLDSETRCVMSDREVVFASWKDVTGALGYYHGEITAKNPDKPLIGKMVRIAHSLNAQVQGDDVGRIFSAHAGGSHCIICLVIDGLADRDMVRSRACAGAISARFC